MTARRALLAILIGCFSMCSAAASPVGVRIVVTSQDDASVSEIDAQSDRVVARMGVGPGPAGLTGSADGRALFVTHPDASIIDVVDMSSRRVVRRLAYRGQPFGIVAVGGALYVSDWSHHLVARVDATSGAVTADVTVGRSPAGLALDPVRHRLYAADRETGDVAVVDIATMREVARIPTGASPFALALSPDGERLYVANVRSNDLAVIDTERLRRIARVPAGTMPYGVAVTPDEAFVLVTNQHGNTLSMIDTKTLAIVASVPVGRYPEGVVVAEGRAYVANWFSGDVSVIDLVRRREVARIKVGDGPRNLTLVAAKAESPDMLFFKTPTGVRATLAILAWMPLLLCLALVGCNDADEPSGEKVVATERPAALPAWLTVKDNIEPAIWLRGREVGHRVLASDPEVDRIRRALYQAGSRFYEDSRMIANRTAQTGEMLAETGQPERYVDIMTGMIDVADVSPHQKLYGEMCQHYLNIRKAGQDRTASIEILMKAYKAGGTQN